MGMDIMNTAQQEGKKKKQNKQKKKIKTTQGKRCADFGSEGSVFKSQVRHDWA